MIRLRTPIAASLLALGLLTLNPAAIGADTQAARPAAKSAAVAKSSIDRGRYLVKIAGCNDCHTAGYAMKEGKVPEAEWLTGDSFGWRGTWGTTYAVNLRQYMQTMTEAEWMQRARTMKTRPPMPWFALNEMAQDDLRAIYRYIRQAGPAGSPAPAYVPPDKEPKPPYATFPGPPK